MSKHSTVFIGIDTHKSFIEVAYIEDVRDLSRARETAMKDLKDGKYQHDNRPYLFNIRLASSCTLTHFT